MNTRTRSAFLHLVAILILSCGLVAQQHNSGAAAAGSNATRTSAADRDAPGSPRLQTRNPRYKIEPGDVLDVLFSFTPEFNQTVTIQPDGYIALRDLQDIHVAGKSVPELAQLLKSAYAAVLHDPAIVVVLKQFERPHFVISGQVGKPGKYDLRTTTTVTEAVAIAGGVTDRAKHSQVLLFRHVSEDWVEVKKVNLKKLYAGDLREDIRLMPGDIIFVPQNTISKIRPFLPVSALSAYLSPASL